MVKFIFASSVCIIGACSTLIALSYFRLKSYRCKNFDTVDDTRSYDLLSIRVQHKILCADSQSHAIKEVGVDVVCVGIINRIVNHLLPRRIPLIPGDITVADDLKTQLIAMPALRFSRYCVVDFLNLDDPTVDLRLFREVGYKYDANYVVCRYNVGLTAFGFHWVFTQRLQPISMTRILRCLEPQSTPERAVLAYSARCRNSTDVNTNMADFVNGVVQNEANFVKFFAEMSFFDEARLDALVRHGVFGPLTQCLSLVSNQRKLTLLFASILIPWCFMNRRVLLHLLAAPLSELHLFFLIGKICCLQLLAAQRDFSTRALGSLV